MGSLIMGLLLIALGVWILRKHVKFTLFHLIPIPRWLVGGFILLMGISMAFSGIRFMLW